MLIHGAYFSGEICRTYQVRICPDLSNTEMEKTFRGWAIFFSVAGFEIVFSQVERPMEEQHACTFLPIFFAVLPAG
jgi:hypothetical protein